MQDVRNGDGKLVCQIDGKHRLVEILHKGWRTQIYFMANNTIKVINLKNINKTAV